MIMTKLSPLHEINRFFEDVAEFLPRRYGFDLAVDLYQEKNNLIAEMSIPGIDIENTEVSVLGDQLLVRGTRERKTETDEKNYYAREITRGSFERSVTLPQPVVAEETQATYKDGVLKVSMPLKGGPISKKIEIRQE